MKQWIPSNGDDAMYMESYCGRCEKDRASWPLEKGGDDMPEKGCPIIAAMYRNRSHPAWITKDGHPHCTEFQEEIKFVKETRCDKTIDMFDGRAFIK